MKAFLYLSALLILGCVTAGCGDNAVTTPSPASSAKFTATLLPASEVPPISGSEAGGSGTAALTFNLTRDSGGNTTAADQANSIMANPAGFYLNIHTAANPGGVARGQLTAAQ